MLGPAPQKWDYRIVTLSGDDPIITGALNGFAGDGWEFVSVITSMSNWTCIRVILRRPR